MATLDATVGGASANSYVTVVEADDYFDSRLNSDLWSTASKDAALITAAYDLDSVFNFVGDEVDDIQNMEWPRNFVDGYENTEIPFDIKRAQMELAYSYIQSGYSVSQKESVDEVKLGSLELVLNNGSSDRLIPSHIVTIVGELGYYTENSTDSVVLVPLSR